MRYTDEQRAKAMKAAAFEAKHTGPFKLAPALNNPREFALAHYRQVLTEAREAVRLCCPYCQNVMVGFVCCGESGQAVLESELEDSDICERCMSRNVADNGTYCAVCFREVEAEQDAIVTRCKELEAELNRPFLPKRHWTDSAT